MYETVKKKQAGFAAQLPAIILFHATACAGSYTPDNAIIKKHTGKRVTTFLKNNEMAGFNNGKNNTAQQQLAGYRLMQNTPGI